ncbi:helix-turn-helix domain containing protein [Lentisphaera profundi]|uniref:Helix-turn-helix domain containing protein n=1 Tax=Lentisphaera profundi TaxID=1658616 RepID=A0ABY7VXC5_9BACT|nr:helix-turn-helix domain-containing protein [Lentisphaera profundi]WDE97855.1 helix-turn-helix domain containing protein [Lentisphaera profundi]
MDKKKRNIKIIEMSSSMTHKQIAKELDVSVKTVQRTIKNVHLKMSTSKPKNVHQGCPPKMSTTDINQGCPLDKKGLTIEDFTHHKTILFEGCSINQLETAVYHLEGKLKNMLTRSR